MATLLVLLSVFPAFAGDSEDRSDHVSDVESIIQTLPLSAQQDMDEQMHGMLSADGLEIQAGEQHAVVVSGAIEVPLRHANPFLALSGSWQADSEIPELVDLDFRYSRDGDNWSEWIHAGFDHHTTIDDGLHHGELIFADKNTRFIQYRLSLQRDEKGASPRLTELKLHFISPGETPEAMQNEIDRFTPENRRTAVERRQGDRERFRDSEGRQRESRDRRRDTRLQGDMADDDFMIQGNGGVYPLPDYVDRETWGETLDLTNTASRSVTNVTHLIVHHSAGQTNSSDFAAVVRTYWDSHVNGRGWADIGYNWLVDGNGVVYQGRAFSHAGNKDVIGAHFSGYNQNTMGVCVIGHYSNQMPTDDAIFSLNEVLAWKASDRGLDPGERSQHYSPGGNIYRVSGHRDSGIFTECPGQQLYNYLPTIRNNVAEIMEGLFDPGELAIELNWERSFDNENAWDWFGSESSETELSIDYYDGMLYVASSSTGSHVRIINAENGFVEESLDVGPIAQSTFGDDNFVIAIARVTEDGYLVVSNRTSDATSNPFRLIVIDPASESGMAHLEYDDEARRLGYQLSVAGKFSQNSLAIYTPVPFDGTVLRWQGISGSAEKALAGSGEGADGADSNSGADGSTSSGRIANTGGPEILTLDGMTEWGQQAAIALKPLEAPGFFAGGLQSDVIREFDQDGKPVGQMTFSQGTTNLSGLQYASYQGREYLFAYHPEERQVRWHTLFGEPGDENTDRTGMQVYLGESIGSTSNRTTINIGDITVRDNRNGSFDVFALAPNNGIRAYYFEGPEYDGPVSAEDDDKIVHRPETFNLEQNYPNPFNPVTNILYDLPESSEVRLEVYNTMGQRVAILVDTHQQAGSHSVAFDGSNLASGVYMYRIRAGSFVETRQMTLIK